MPPAYSKAPDEKHKPKMGLSEIKGTQNAEQSGINGLTITLI